MPVPVKGDYLAGKSEREIARLLGHKGQALRTRGRSGRRLKADVRWQSWEFEMLGKLPDKAEAAQFRADIEAEAARLDAAA